MNPYQAHEAFSGTYAQAIEDGVWLAQFHSITVDLDVAYEEVKQSGKLNPGEKFSGYKITGSMTGHQYDSSFIKRLTGFMRDPKKAPLVTNLLLVNDDPAVNSPYKVQLYGVKYSKFPLFNGEHGTPVEQEFAFSADSFEILED
ncbi:phage tail tube protein [Sporosarcina sp. A2]|uniref:phage tail tube protein n=1 Tax=Sporosarcina sp. A2 TaxID=3393449 RepID=UPI003D7B63E6